MIFQVDAQEHHIFSNSDAGLEKEGANLHLEFTEYLQIFIVGGYT